MIRLLMIFTFLAIVNANANAGVILNCNILSYCNILEEEMSDLRTLKKIKEKVQEVLVDGELPIRSLEIKKRASETDEDFLVEIVFKKKINDISFESNGDIDLGFLEQALSVKEGDFYKRVHKDAIENDLKKYFDERGFEGIVFDTKIEEDQEYISIKVFLDVQNVPKVKEIELISDSNSSIEEILKRLRKFKGKQYNKLDIKVKLEQISQEFFQRGFFYSKFELLPFSKSSNTDIRLNIKVSLGSRFNFNFTGNKIFSRTELVERIRLKIKNNYTSFEDDNIVEIISDLYKERGLYGNDITFRTFEGKTKSNKKFKNFYIDIKEGKKRKVSSIVFLGSNSKMAEILRNLYDEGATALVSNDFYDEKYVEKFVEVIKKSYLSHGYVLVKIAKPIIEEVNGNLVITFRIQEGNQCFVSNINVRGLSDDESNSIVSLLKNIKDEPLDITKIEDDLSLALEKVRSFGYYFAEIKEDNILQYNPDYTSASINLSFNAGKKSVLNNIIIVGYKKTKRIVIEREIGLKKGDLITPEEISEIQSKLNSLRLFSKVNINLIVVNDGSLDKLNKINLLIQVNERDYGLVEIAPGFRTDLGLKFEAGITYKNTSGMDRTVDLNLQANQRINKSGLDTTRREGNPLLEGKIRFSYSEPYLYPKFFGSKVDFNFSLTAQRKRFFSFDADIFRASPRITRKFSKNVSATLKYQFETIDQFNATELKDRVDFRIGAFTPSLTFDFRDNPVLPTSGALLNLTWEFASPKFGSIDEENITVNFDKLISRNRFYFPLGNWVFATSLSMGVQRNKAGSDSFIPSIRVFRLDGIDTVRGFSDSEVNRLESGEDIETVEINDRAYFANFKFEPRYYISDSFIWSLFFDAGRVYVRHFKPLDLRTAFGTSFKFVTPVGTLDFDYGVKFRRLRYEGNNIREGFGRFHLLVGFF